MLVQISFFPFSFQSKQALERMVLNVAAFSVRPYLEFLGAILLVIIVAGEHAGLDLGDAGVHGKQVLVQ